MNLVASWTADDPFDQNGACQLADQSNGVTLSDERF